MALLQRADGLRFAIRSYRESVIPKKSSLLRKELFLLSQTHGQYARFFKQRDGRIEAVFSRDSGYLLGETVWEYFGKPDDLVYCEVLPSEQEVIIVIVRAGSIYLDAKLTIEELKEELRSLFTTDVRYDIYAVGNAPIAQEAMDDAFVVRSESIKRFTKLEQGVFEVMPVSPGLVLLSFEQAIAELKLDVPVKNIAVAATVLLLLIAVWQALTPSEPEQQKTMALNPYEQYAAALANPEPMEQLDELAKQVILLQSLPGWIPVSIDYIPAGTKVSVRTLGSPTQLLLEWAAKNGAKVDFNNEGAKLLLPSKLGARNNIPPLTSSIKSLSKVIDGMMQIIPGKSVSIIKTETGVAYKTTALAINFKQGSPIVLVLIGKALSGLPVVINSNALTIENGLLSGTIQLTVLGS